MLKAQPARDLLPAAARAAGGTAARANVRFIGLIMCYKIIKQMFKLAVRLGFLLLADAITVFGCSDWKDEDEQPCQPIQAVGNACINATGRIGRHKQNGHYAHCKERNGEADPERPKGDRSLFCVLFRSHVQGKAIPQEPDRSGFHCECDKSHVYYLFSIIYVNIVQLGANKRKWHIPQKYKKIFDIGGHEDGTRDTADARGARGDSGRAGTGDPEAEQGAPGMAADGSDGIPRCRIKENTHAEGKGVGIFHSPARFFAISWNHL